MSCANRRLVVRRYLVPIFAAVVLASCSSASNASDSSGATASPDATPSPLKACETREVTLDGADLVVTANADATLSSVRVVDSNDNAASTAAEQSAERAFGPLHRDTRVIAHQNKWGLTTFSDECGRPATPVLPYGRTTPKP